MNSLINIDNKELELIIQNTSNKLKISSAIIEKDLWVCIILKYLFNDFKYKDNIVFKGGTSLSKVYNLIERFSEDIDIALDWKLLGYNEDELYSSKSNTAQNKINKDVNDKTKNFLKEVFVPILEEDFKKILLGKEFSFYIDDIDEQTICFAYPKNYNDDSILQIIRLEIGCLAEPKPSKRFKIKTYIEQAYPNKFDEAIEVLAVDSLRTFFEKITILHREANRINGNYPSRYSRHFYDIYKMLQTDIKNRSLNNISLLRQVIEFKKKFYSCSWAKYDEIMEGKLKLIPSRDAIKVFNKDYDNMKNMLFGEKVEFELIINELTNYEKELNDKIISYIDI